MNLSSVELSKYITSNPDILQSMSEEELIQLQDRVNPYAQTVGDDKKGFAIFSHVNCRSDYWKTFKAISLARFVKQLCSESKDWCKDAKGLAEEERESFCKHMQIFGEHFLQYRSDKDCRESVHFDQGDSSDYPAADFFHRWQRYEDQNTNAIKEDMRKRFAYRTKQDAAIQVYTIVDTEEQAQEYVNRHALTIGVDLTVAPTHTWAIVTESEDTLDKTHFIDDDDHITSTLISQMKKDAKIGEQMINKRIQSKVADNKQQHGEVPEQAKTFLSEKQYNTKPRVEPQLQEDQTVDCPIIMSGAEQLSKAII